jgi:hypothetical protein
MWLSKFAIGSLLVLLLPVAFIPLLGYAIAATRAAGARSDPPHWGPSMRLLTDGFWTALVLLLLSAPFLLAFEPLAGAIKSAHLWPIGDRSLPQSYAGIAAAFVLALPWGLILLLLMPHGTSRFATSGRPQDLFDFPLALRDVGRDFPVWNVVAAAMVTAWVVALACVGLLCIGLLPGVFYAILVSAHASASLNPAAGPTGAHLPAR